MARRDRLREARRGVFRNLVEQLERDRATSDLDQAEVIDALLVEFRRRGRLTPIGAPPDHPSLPGLEITMEIKVGDMIRYASVPIGVMDVEVLEIKDCDGDMNDSLHPMYRIQDPETGEPDWVCSREVVRT